MARLSSRELALERRKALTTSGKKAAVASGSGRVRIAADARSTRTLANASDAVVEVSTPAVAVAPRRPQSLTASSAPRSRVKPVRQPSRELVLARRDALSRRGKTADKTSDRNRADVARQTQVVAQAASTESTKKDCGCGTKRGADPSAGSARPAAAVQLSGRTSDRRQSTPKRRAIENPSRALVLARRDAMSKHGKTAGKQPTSAAAVARQANPDLTSRELAQQVRELRAKSGSRTKQSAGITRPSGPNRHGAKQPLLLMPIGKWVKVRHRLDKSLPVRRPIVR